MRSSSSSAGSAAAWVVCGTIASIEVNSGRRRCSSSRWRATPCAYPRGSLMVASSSSRRASRSSASSAQTSGKSTPRHSKNFTSVRRRRSYSAPARSASESSRARRHDNPAAVSTATHRILPALSPGHVRSATSRARAARNVSPTPRPYRTPPRGHAGPRLRVVISKWPSSGRPMCRAQRMCRPRRPSSGPTDVSAQAGYQRICMYPASVTPTLLVKVPNSDEAATLITSRGLK